MGRCGVESVCRIRGEHRRKPCWRGCVQDTAVGRGVDQGESAPPNREFYGQLARDTVKVKQLTFSVQLDLRVVS